MPGSVPDEVCDVKSAANDADGRPVTGAPIGVVPVCHDDRDAPAGCAALRELRGTPLLMHAVDALLRSGAVGEVVIAVPPALVPLVGHLLDAGRLPGPGREAARVVAVRENGHGYRVRAVLRQFDPSDVGPVVVHDPLYPLAPAALVRAVLEELIREGAAARPRADVATVPVRPVTDTLKRVDEDGVVVGTADRNRFQMVSSPQAYRRDRLLRTLEGAGDDQLREPGAEVLPRLVRAGGGHLLPVPATGDLLRLFSGDDLLLAEAMLDA